MAGIKMNSGMGHGPIGLIITLIVALLGALFANGNGKKVKAQFKQNKAQSINENQETEGY